MRRVSLLVLIYVVIGVYIAWTRHYITVSLLKSVLQALLAIVLWFLVLLGVDLHVR
ncbi:MAG TPA: hypothetical protein VFA45_22550 [Actinomycetes bacterium]|jgi:hypothetical protein|nr:hypothetical protein [Actinomycetes bacterium]